MPKSKSQGRFCPNQQIGKVVVYAGNTEVRFTLERAPDIVYAVRTFDLEFDDCKNKVVRLVEGEYRISFRVTVIVAAPVTRPFTSMKRSLPVPGTRLVFELAHKAIAQG